jgi:hypothetical protein
MTSSEPTDEEKRLREDVDAEIEAHIETARLLCACVVAMQALLTTRDALTRRRVERLCVRALKHARMTGLPLEEPRAPAPSGL